MSSIPLSTPPPVYGSGYHPSSASPSPSPSVSSYNPSGVAESASSPHARQLMNDDISFCCPSSLSCVLSSILPWSWLCACTQVNEREEIVYLNWGKFSGVLRVPGLYCVNPYGMVPRKVSTAIQSFDVPVLKVVDIKGNPLRVSGVLTYQVKDSRTASVEVADYLSYLSVQAEVVLKQICSSHPYQSSDAKEDSLKREADKVKSEIINLIQTKAEPAGIQILSFEFKELSYAPEIAAAMLVRQQAEAMLEARTIVVSGAVGIATDTVQQLRKAGLPISDAEATRLASNLIVTLTSEAKVTPTMALTPEAGLK